MYLEQNNNENLRQHKGVYLTLSLYRLLTARRLLCKLIYKAQHSTWLCFEILKHTWQTKGTVWGGLNAPHFIRRSKRKSFHRALQTEIRLKASLSVRTDNNLQKWKRWPIWPRGRPELGAPSLRRRRLSIGVRDTDARKGQVTIGNVNTESRLARSYNRQKPPRRPVGWPSSFPDGHHVKEKGKI